MSVIIFLRSAWLGLCIPEIGRIFGNLDIIVSSVLFRLYDLKLSRRPVFPKASHVIVSDALNWNKI